MHTSMNRAEAKIREKITLLTFRCQGPGFALARIGRRHGLAKSLLCPQALGLTGALIAPRLPGNIFVCKFRS